MRWVAPGLGQSPALECVFWARLRHTLPPLPPAEAGKRQLCMTSQRSTHSFRSPHEAPIKPPTVVQARSPQRGAQREAMGNLTGGLAFLCLRWHVATARPRVCASLGNSPRLVSTPDDDRPRPSTLLGASMLLRWTVRTDHELLQRKPKVVANGLNCFERPQL